MVKKKKNWLICTKCGNKHEYNLMINDNTCYRCRLPNLGDSMKRRCKRCEDIFEATSKYSSICLKCHKPHPLRKNANKN